MLWFVVAQVERTFEVADVYFDLKVFINGFIDVRRLVFFFGFRTAKVSSMGNNR
jgi:hypothetical protein